MAFKSSFTLLFLLLSTICDAKRRKKLMSYQRDHGRCTAVSSSGVNTMIGISCTDSGCTLTWNDSTTNSGIDIISNTTNTKKKCLQFTNPNNESQLYILARDANHALILRENGCEHAMASTGSQKDDFLFFESKVGGGRRAYVYNQTTDGGETTERCIADNCSETLITVPVTSTKEINDTRCQFNKY